MHEALFSVPTPSPSEIVSFESVSVRSNPDDFISMIKSHRDHAEVTSGAQGRTDQTSGKGGEVRLHCLTPSGHG